MGIETLEDQLRTYLKNFADIMPKRQGFKYSGFESYYLANGHMYQREPYTRDERIAIMAMMTKMHFSPVIKQCFYNAQTMMSYGFSYAEGYVVSDDLPIPIHHGWNVLNGKPVDLTLQRGRVRKTANPKTLLERASYNLEHFLYFGVEFPRETIMSIWRSEEIARPVVDDWKNGFPLLKE